MQKLNSIRVTKLLTVENQITYIYIKEGFFSKIVEKEFST